MALTGTTQVAGLVTTAYDQAVENQNRHVPMLRNLPDKHLVSPTHAGSTYRLFKYNDLTTGSRLLTETTDTTAVAVPDVTPLDVAVKEFGATVSKTKLLDLVSLAQIDPIIVDLLARDQAVSLDSEVGTIAYAGTNVVRAANRASTATVAAGDVMKAADYRQIITKLRENAASPRRGDLYAVYLHPRVALDLRTETGANAWRDDHKYAAPDLFWSGETGQYEGGFVVESARMKVAADGAASINVYRSLFAGRQALAEVVWEAPHTVIGEVVDNLKRFRPISWYGALNWAIYRQENLFRYESASTLG
jgi:N4-gp56 family major capsid protein